eukprot:2434726-Pleurochrysis_carterae.AAC.1
MLKTARARHMTGNKVEWLLVLDLYLHLILCPRKPEVDACCVLVAPSTCSTNFPERHGQPSLVCSPLHGSKSNERDSICALICRFDTV